LESQW